MSDERSNGNIQDLLSPVAATVRSIYTRVRESKTEKNEL